MSKSDFTKTAVQVEREIRDLIDSVDRSLDSSSGDSERKGQLVLTAFLSVVVFLSILAFEHLVGARRLVAPTQSGEPNLGANILDAGDVSLLNANLSRLDLHANMIMKTKNRVAPAMPIEGNISSIISASADIRQILDLETVEKPLTKESALPLD